MFLFEVKTCLFPPRLAWFRCISCSVYKLQLDYYKVLEVSTTATSTEIKRAYLQKCKEYHPDKHRGSKTMQAKFIEANKAYNVLSNDMKRREYDARFKHISQSPRYQHQSPYRWGAESKGPHSNPEDVFRQYHRESQRFKSQQWKRQQDPFYDYWQKMYNDNQYSSNRGSSRDPFGSSDFKGEDHGNVQIEKKFITTFFVILFCIIFMRVFIAIKAVPSGRRNSILDPDFVPSKQPYSYNNKRPITPSPSKPDPIDLDIKTEEA